MSVEALPGRSVGFWEAFRFRLKLGFLAAVESWDDVPPPSTQLRAARDAIYAHVERLIDELSGGQR